MSVIISFISSLEDFFPSYTHLTSPRGRREGFITAKMGPLSDGGEGFLNSRIERSNLEGLRGVSDTLAGVPGALKD